MNNKNCEHCQTHAVAAAIAPTKTTTIKAAIMNNKLTGKVSDAVKSMRTTPATTAIVQPTHSSQLCQHQQLQQQRSSSVGSTGSSICDSISSHSGSVLSPNELSTNQINHQQYSSLSLPLSLPLQIPLPLPLQLQLQLPTPPTPPPSVPPLPSSQSSKSSRCLQRAIMIKKHHDVIDGSINVTKNALGNTITTPIPPSGHASALSAALTGDIEAATRCQTPEAPAQTLLQSTERISGTNIQQHPQQHQQHSPQQQQSLLTPIVPPPPPAPPTAVSIAPMAQSVPPPPSLSSLVNGSGAAAMAANLAESFSLLHQQAHHFRDILYAAHLIGRGYYQPAGPLISTPHVLPPVSSGLPLPPPPNVPLLPTGGGIKGKCSLATPPISVSTISTDSEHLQQLQQARGGVGGVGTQNANSAVETSSMENDVLVAGGDLTPFRYPTQNLLNSGATVQHQQQQQQHQQQQQQQQQHQTQQHQLHQQAAAAAAVAAAAAAVAAHPSSSYPRSIHAQMHYSPPYPANYYSPYPGEPMCYSPPAYQPYFSSKVYQSAPPPPHPPPPAAYRHYPYYQTGHPPPPTDLYEQVPGPPTGSSGQQGGPVPIQGAPPPSQPPGTQLVPAGQHVEHYPGPPTYYAGYNTTGAAAAAQCYTRSLQGPYMEYPPAQCPCPMQQSCPKNVHTGPHIGSNTSGNSNNSSSNNNNNINNNTALTNGNNMTINHNNNGAIVAIQHNSHNNIECNNNNNINKNNNNINCTKNNNSNNNNNNSHTNIINNSHTNKMQACNNGVMNVSNGSNAMPMLNTNRGPVKICNTETTTATTTITTNLYEDNDKIVSDMVNKNHNNLDILSPTAVKTELKLEEFDNKSQYEETFIPPLTPLTIDKDDKYEGIKVAAKEAIIPAVLPIFEDVEEALDKLQDAKSPTHSIMPTAHLYNGNTIEEYDLTTATPPLITNSNKNTNTNKGSYNLNNQINTVNNSTQQVGPPTVIRRARIGKTMAREMVYAAANTITPSFTNNVSTRSINGPVLPKPISNNELTHITPKPTPKVIVNTTPAHNQAPSIAVTPIANTLSKLEAIVPVAIPLVLKAEIKSEKIKLEEDEVLDKVLRQQIMTATTTTTTKQSSSHSSAIQTSSLAPQSSITSFASQIHINQEKIKAEPINVNEILLHDSKVKLENDHECELEIVPDVKKVVQKPKEIVAVKEVTVNKVKNRMRLLPSWQQPTLSCDIDLCHTSEDDEILDLCHSPICNGNGNGKRIKTLDYSKAQCKKSPPNSYKSLIKQTQPKTYLCLSRKINKKSRYGKLQTTKSSKANANNGTTVRRRELILTDQQKQRLRLRKKKLAAMEKQKMEAKELRKREHKQKHKELKQNTHKSPSLSPSCLSGASLKLKSAKEIKIENDSVIVDLIGEEEEEPIKLVTDVESVKDKCIENDICQQGLLRNDLDTINLSNVSFRASPKHVKSVKKPAIPQHIKETIDAVARGYFSEPETHSAVICVASSPPHATQSPINVSDAKDQDAVVTCSKVNSKHLKTNAEKRSKSESKKPIKMYSTGSMAVGNATCIDLKKRNLESKSVTPADGIVMKFSKTTTINNDVLTTTATTTTTLSPVVVAAATTTTTTTATASTTISTSTHLQDAQLIENQNIHNNNNINNNNNNNNNKNIINNNYSMKFDESLMMKTDRKNLKKDKEKSKYKKSKISQKDRNKISHMNVVNVQGKEAAATIINITRTETGAGPVITTTTAPTTIPTTDISRDNNHNKNDNEIEALSTITISDHHSSASSSSSSVSPTPSSTLSPSPSPSSSSLSLIKEQHTNELNNNKVLTSSNQPQQQKQQQHQHDMRALPIEIDCNDIGASDKTYIDLTQNATEELYLQTVQQQQEQQQQQHSDDLMTDSMFLAPPPLPRIVCNSQYHQQHSVKRNRSRSKFGSRKRQKLKHSTVSFELDETLPPATRVDVIPKWNNGWTWEGKPFQGAVFLNSDDPLVLRTCYPAMRHVEGDSIRTRDCVLLKANEDNELPYVAKVAHLWENPEDGEMMMSLLWYYRPEHTEQGRQPNDSSDEVYASRHRDHNSVACIEDKCYVLTFSEYCRYRRRIRASEEDIEDVNIVPKRLNYLNIRNVPDNTNPELIMFCRRAYEFRTKRLLKMPNKQDYYVVKA